MLKVFAEYQILPQHRPAYSAWIAGVRAKHWELEVFEGVDQPGLFIEVWDGLSCDAYQQLKSARLPQTDNIANCTPGASDFADMDWERMNEWVAGGASKIHLWHFRKVL
jgi:hypothetical protein